VAEVGQVRVSLLHCDGIVSRDAREGEVLGGGVHEHHGQAQLQEALVMPVGRVGLRVLAPAKIIPETWRSSSISTYSASEVLPVRVQSTALTPRWASAPATTSASAGKTGFWSSGTINPTMRARRTRR